MMRPPQLELLLVPQWQGADAQPLRDGAKALARRLALPFLELPVDSGGPRGPELGILHRRNLKQNLATVRERLAVSGAPRVLTVGGDCSVELGPVSWLRSVWGEPLHLVWLDAHADLNTPSTSPTGCLHGMPLRHLLGEGDPELLSILGASCESDRVHLVGARALDPAELEFIETARLNHYATACRTAVEGRQLAMELLPAATPTYVHLDLDVLDPAEFAGVCCPEPGGWTPAAVAGFCAGATERAEVVGLGLMEHLERPGPGLDHIGALLTEVQRLVRRWKA
jgi:arginase